MKVITFEIVAVIEDEQAANSESVLDCLLSERIETMPGWVSYDLDQTNERHIPDFS